MTHCKFSTSTDGAPNDYRTHDSLNTSDLLYYLHNTNDSVYKSSSIITNDPLYDSQGPNGSLYNSHGPDGSLYDSHRPNDSCTSLMDLMARCTTDMGRINHCTTHMALWLSVQLIRI